MSSGAHKFRQTEVVRAIKAVRAAGEEIAGVEIDTDGRIRLILGKPTQLQPDDKNEWDEVLDGECRTKIRQGVP